MGKMVNNYDPDSVQRNQFKFQDLIDGLKNDKFKKILVICGANASKSAGIPDFRTKKTCLTPLQQEFDLPKPNSIVDLDYFQENPLPFYQMANRFMKGEQKPTLAHSLLKILHDKGMLKMVFSENNDLLEQKAGISDDKIQYVNGRLQGAMCSKCFKKHNEKAL